MPETKHDDAPALPTTFPTPVGAVTAARTSTRATSSVPSQRGRSRRTEAAPVRLGSIVTATAPAQAHLARCSGCAGTSLTRLAMTLTDGTAVTFVSCHHCEVRAWFAADGAAVGLDAVLGSAAKA
ncbi:hypothetical protein [uncultured Cellulomonas sp.]|uniref:hypothetical protein n=1 Tax=uncultured Cellulomonas sp. TaxID=189682 RepID=UPI002634F617|nr:hypothetical protein [uncultured Cellulomonas sp.]